MSRGERMPAKDKEQEGRGPDPASREMLAQAARQGMETVWDRSEEARAHCRVGIEGICCRVCNMGPCGIGPKRPRGVCGADADTIAARNLVRAIAAGVSAHSDHGRHLVHTLKLVAHGSAEAFRIRDERRLVEAAREYGIGVEGLTALQVAGELAKVLEREFAESPGPMKTLEQAPRKRRELWEKTGVEPRGIDPSVVEMMHRTTMGVDHSFRSLEMAGIRTALADGWGGSTIATTVSDILFGTPKPVRSVVNLGVLSPDKVNIVVHGHEPALSEVIVAVCRELEMLSYAREKGAAGIQVSGICCTANEILMRHGVPQAGNFLQQELAVMTGAVEMMLVDVQCVMPSLAPVARCFHTAVVGTSSRARTEGFEAVEFDASRALDQARDLVRRAVDNFPNRKPEKVCIPAERMELPRLLPPAERRHYRRPHPGSGRSHRLQQSQKVGGKHHRAHGQGPDREQRAGATDGVRGRVLRQGRLADSRGGAAFGRAGAARSVRGGRHAAGAAHGLLRGQQPDPGGGHRGAQGRRAG